jgi:hypothetical protein
MPWIVPRARRSRNADAGKRVSVRQLDGPIAGTERSDTVRFPRTADGGPDRDGAANSESSRVPQEARTKAGEVTALAGLVRPLC